MDNARFTRALCAIDDNAVEIARLRAQTSNRTEITELAGETRDGVTSFGRVTALGAFFAVAVFDGEPCALSFGGKTLAASGSPIVAVGGSGCGELCLDGVRVGARAVVIGARHETETTGEKIV